MSVKRAQHERSLRSGRVPRSRMPPPTTCGNRRGEQAGRTSPTPKRTVCCSPIAAPLLAAPASSATAVNASPFHAIDRPPASAMPERAARAALRRALRSRPATATTSRLAQVARSAIRRRPTSGRRRCGMRRENQRDADDECRVASRKPVLVVQEEDAEADDRHLRVDVEPADERKPPDPAIAERAHDRPSSISSSARVPQHDRPRRTDSRQPSEKEERGLEPPAERAAERRARQSAPSGTAVCRIPSARPRSSARTSASPRVRSPSSRSPRRARRERAGRTATPKIRAYAAPTRQTAEPARPSARTRRSP